MSNWPAIEGFADASQARVFVLASGQQAHVPATGLGLQPAGNYQPLDGDLTAIAALSGTGLAQRTGTDTWATVPLAVGTWTPTLTNTTNVASSTASLCHYIRIGNQVLCWGAVTLTPTAAGNTTTVLGISLPVASAFASVENCRGAAGSTVAQRGGGLRANTAAGRAELVFTSETTSAILFGVSFGYEVI